MKNLDISEVQKTSSNLPTSLNLNQNQLKELPNDFHQLSSSLNSLSLNKNQLTSVPILSNCEFLVVD
jgi:Leucine-rich repeat (LRR) protein